MEKLDLEGLKYETYLTPNALKQIQDMLQYNWNRDNSPIYEITKLWRQ